MTNIDIENSKNMLINVFKDKASAESAYNLLIEKGYDQDDIYILMSDETRGKYFSHENFPENNMGVETDHSKGMKIGGMIGAVAAAVAAIGTVLTIPGLGLVIAGPLAAGLAGAGAGGIAGGLVDALVDTGIPEVQAKMYEQEIRNGGIIVGVKVRSDEEFETLKSKFNSY